MTRNQSVTRIQQRRRRQPPKWPDAMPTSVPITIEMHGGARSRRAARSARPRRPAPGPSGPTRRCRAGSRRTAGSQQLAGRLGDVELDAAANSSGASSATRTKNDQDDEADHARRAARGTRARTARQRRRGAAPRRSRAADRSVAAPRPSRRCSCVAHPRVEPRRTSRSATRLATITDGGEQQEQSPAAAGSPGRGSPAYGQQPRPGQENTVSIVIAPETTKPRLRKISVIVGSSALGTACLRRTRSSRRPLARAVCR